MDLFRIRVDDRTRARAIREVEGASHQQRRRDTVTLQLRLSDDHAYSNRPTGMPADFRKDE